MPTTHPRNRLIGGLLWGAFALLAVVGSLVNQRAVSLICWSIALIVALVLVRRQSYQRSAKGSETTDLPENV